MPARTVPMLISIGLLWALAACAAWQGGANEPALRRFEFTRLLMGVKARIVVYSPDEDAARAGAGAAFDRIAALEEVMSDYRDASEVSRLTAGGAGAGREVEVSGDLFRVLETAGRFTDLSGGAFDVSVGPLSRLWRTARETGRLPDDEALAGARARSGWRHVRLDPARRGVRLGVEGMRFDLGGIGKGFAAQEAADLLRERGLARCLVALAGDVVVGEPPPEVGQGGGDGWRVEIAGVPGEEGRVITVSNRAVSTSGDAEQFVEIGGVRYSHLVDSRTGLGSTRRIGAVVVARDGATADAAASALALLGPEAAPGFLSRVGGVSAIVAERAGPGVLRFESDGIPEVGSGPGAAGALAPEGFTSLFSGVDLTGWAGVIDGGPPALARMSPRERTNAQREADAAMRRHWSAVDGELAFDGRGPSIRTLLEYGDVELLLEWKIEQGGDSGVYLRGVPQVQIWDNPIGSGGLYNNQKGPSRPRAVADRPPGEWNRFRIVMRGERVWVWLNAVPVVEGVPLENYWEPGKPLYPRGPIELQAHGTPLRFRNIFVRELAGEPEHP